MVAINKTTKSLPPDSNISLARLTDLISSFMVTPASPLSSFDF